MTSPGYPVYQMGTLFAGGLLPFSAPHPGEPLPAGPGRTFRPWWPGTPRPCFSTIPTIPPRRWRIKSFSPGWWTSAGSIEIIAVHDAAYTELAYDGFKPPSFLEVPGAKEIGIEFHSLSKTYNMTGWRLGMAVGNREVLAALGKIKSNIDSGAFDAIQIAGHRRPGFGPELRPGKLRHSPGTPGYPGGRPAKTGL